MSNVICSDQNPLIKKLRKLQQKKHRDASGQFVIEGMNLVEEAIQKGIEIDSLLISDTFSEEEFSAIQAPSGLRIEKVHHSLFEKLTDARSGVGVVAIVNKPRQDKADVEAVFRNGTNYVVLDRLQDPGNIGTIVRTAVAAGYDGVIALKGTADLYSPKVLRATAGMIFHIPILFLEDVDELVELAKATDKNIAVTTPVGGVPYFDCDLREDVLLVIGNEGNGISPELIEAASLRVTLPMYGSIESLNAAVSAAILMYERVRPERDGR